MSNFQKTREPLKKLFWKDKFEEKCKEKSKELKYKSIKLYRNKKNVVDEFIMETWKYFCHDENLLEQEINNLTHDEYINIMIIIEEIFYKDKKETSNDVIQYEEFIEWEEEYLRDTIERLTSTK